MGHIIYMMEEHQDYSYRVFHPMKPLHLPQVRSEESIFFLYQETVEMTD